MCDPVIDEHFRRSLGERYTHLFASSPASSSLAAADSSSHPSTESKTLASTVNVTGLSGNQSGRLYRFSSPPPSDANEKLPSRKSTSSLTNLLNSAIFFIFKDFNSARMLICFYFYSQWTTISPKRWERRGSNCKMRPTRTRKSASIPTPSRSSRIHRFRLSVPN